MRRGILCVLLVGCGGRIDGGTLDATVDVRSDVLDVADATDGADASHDAAADASADADGDVATCKSNGTSCSDAAECCTATCDSLGACGTATCPNGPTICETCLAAACCTEELACAADPSCLPIWTCFKACIESNGGSNGSGCINECMPKYEKTAYDFYQCGYPACAGDCW